MLVKLETEDISATSAFGFDVGVDLAFGVLGAFFFSGDLAGAGSSTSPGDVGGFPFLLEENLLLFFGVGQSQDLGFLIIEVSSQPRCSCQNSGPGIPVSVSGC